MEGSIGIVLAFLSAVGFSFTNVLISKGRTKGDVDNGMLITTLSNVAILSSVVVILGLNGYLPGWSTVGFLWFAGSGFLTSFLGRSTLFTSIGLIGSSRAAAIKNTAPVFTVAVAVLFLSERLSLSATIGVGLAGLGLLLLVCEAFRTPGSGRERRGEDKATAQRMTSPETLVDDAAPPFKPFGSAGASAVMVGTLIAVCSAVFFGLGQGIRKVGLEYMPDVFVGATIASWAALFLYLGTSVVRGRTGTVFRASFTNFRPYFWFAGLTTTMGQLGFFAAITFIPVSHVSVIAASETLLTIFLATLLIGRAEQISRRIMVAALLVFAGGAITALS